MKPSSFVLHQPQTLSQALELLEQLGDSAKPLAGGQSLIPLLNFRLAAPDHLIDLGNLPELRGTERIGDVLRIGAMTRHVELQQDETVREGAPLLPAVASHIAHAQIRNRGTIGGSTAHGDPAAELPAALIALDAELVVASARGQRRVAAEDFFLSTLITDLAEDELLVRIDIPVVAGRQASIREFARRHGDFAVAGAVVALTFDEQHISSARVVLIACAGRPVRVPDAEAALHGRRRAEIDASKIGSLVESSVVSVDAQASLATRQRIVSALVRDAVSDCFARVRDDNDDAA